MKFTLSWLREHLETTATIEQISEKLTALGLEVEEVTDKSLGLEKFVVAEIIAAERHPNADKLQVCKVDDGSEVRQIVCGAANARPGIKVVLAKEGVKIPNGGFLIKKSSIRNVESNGMLCSGEELGLADSSQGIIELPAEAKNGEGIIELLGLADPIIEIAITPNRADCLGVAGIARDLAAAGLGTLKSRQTNFAGSGNPEITASIETPNCTAFSYCTIKGVKNAPSPDWLQKRLQAIGLRSISALVDITNYVMYDIGRPLHVYDASKVQGNITIRTGKTGERFTALNEKEYQLSEEMTAICDPNGVLALGGIIGGLASGCSETTTDVILESAVFDPVNIAKTGRTLMVDSDARYRFERGVDAAIVKSGAEIAVNLILQICGGTASEVKLIGEPAKPTQAIEFDYNQVASLGGVNLSKEQIETTLKSLGFSIEGSQVTPPSWRHDVSTSACLVEEIVRIYGYENIDSLTLPNAEKTGLLPKQKAVAEMRKGLAITGMNEVYSWAFMPSEKAALFSETPPLQLLNPISNDLDAMRPSLLPNLIEGCERNIARGFDALSLFEIGNVFADVTLQGHKQMIAGVRTGSTCLPDHFKNSRKFDLFDAKADIFNLLELAGLAPGKLAIDRKVPNYYHPSRSARISLGGKVTLGYFGQIHPLIADKFGVKQDIVAFELFVDAVPIAKAKAKPAFAVSNFQEVNRDFAFIGDEKIAGGDIVKAIENAEKILIKSVNIFDIYSGKGVEPGKKSVAISVKLQAADRTLTDAEIESVSSKIIASVASLGLVLRS